MQGAIAFWGLRPVRGKGDFQISKNVESLPDLIIAIYRSFMKGHRRMTSIHGVQGRRKKLVGSELEAALDDWGLREAGNRGQDFRSTVSGLKKDAGVTRGQHFLTGVSSEEKEGDRKAACVPSKPEKRKRDEGEIAARLQKRQRLGWGGWVGRNLPYWAARMLGAGE